jgi:hypothetical protein
MTECNSSDTLWVRVNIDISYVLNGEDPDDILMRLKKRCESAIDNGLLTGESFHLIRAGSKCVTITQVQFDPDIGWAQSGCSTLTAELV